MLPVLNGLGGQGGEGVSLARLDGGLRARHLHINLAVPLRMPSQAVLAIT